MRVCLILLQIAGCLIGSSALAAEDTGALPKKAVPMSVTAVRNLYMNKTWEWTGGGAYFASDRKYTAVSGEGPTLTTGTGRWLVTAKGALCFVVDWRERRHTYRKKRTCLHHAESGGQVYQMKDHSGEWYVFKSSPPKSSDEYSRFQNGDTIAEAYQAAVRELR